MTSITEIPAGTTHVLTNNKDPLAANFLQLSDNMGESREWHEGVAPMYCKWVYLCRTTIDLNDYTPIGELQDLTKDELIKAEDENAWDMAFDHVKNMRAYNA